MSVSRKTKSVRLVIDLFKNTSNALSVIDLIDTFNGKMNKTTVYRILDSWRVVVNYIHLLIRMD